MSLSNRGEDHVVIGAGVVGCAIASALARRGAGVLVVDARGVGLGATQASAGMLAPYLEGLHHGPLGGFAERSLGLYDRFIEQLSADSGVTLDYDRSGSIKVATAEESAEELKTTAAALIGAGLRCEILDGPAAHEAEPHLAPDIIAGLLVPDHRVVVATELTKALSAAAMKHGARIRVPARVHRISRRDGALDVELDADRIVARNVILAAGSWSGVIAIEGVVPLPVRPIRGQLMQLTWSGQPLVRNTWGSRCYLVPQRDGSLVVGATSEDAGFDERATVAGVRDVLDAACELAPHAWQSGFAGARVGLRPDTPDGLPVIGRAARMPGLVYATGHNRNGILLAPMTADLVADLVLEDRTDPILKPFAPQRFGER